MYEWKDVKDIPMNGVPVLVQLKEPFLNSIMHVGQFREGGLSLIASNFAFDCPDVVCWTELPAPKQI